MELDIREFRLKKWYMPKTKSSLFSEDETLHAVGYFDMIEVGKAENHKNNHLHPWSASYKNSHRATGELQSDYFVQEIKAFTNITEDGEKGFSKEQLKDFWEKENFLLCMSMVHPAGNASLAEILLHIKTIMAGITYLYYFTYDYSGIIIVARDISIKDYLERMFSLNYANEGHSKLIKDTFSIYGFTKTVLSKVNFDEDQSLKTEILNKDFNKYEVTVNISIRNYTKYEQWKKELHDFEQKNTYVSTEKKIAGRHDISIVNREADLYWLLKVQCLLDSYTSDRDSAFYAYETFIKTDRESDFRDNEENDDTLYQRAARELDELYKQFANAAEETGHQSYIIPVREVCNSVLSILKNGFAEDFVVCMYQPFKEFLNYLVRNLKDQRKEESVNYEREFDRCFCAFFDGLNSLVNSAMHTDRQFIQATSFGAIFYDIPPKIMAFYVAMIQRICRVMKKNDDHNYTFFMTPGFSDEIYVRIISYRRKQAEDRILQVFINESFLYHPEAVMRRMVHEIAHFEGDGLRNRVLRKEKMIETYVFEILRMSVPAVFGGYQSLAENFLSILKLQEDFSAEKENYSRDNDYLCEKILTFIIEYGEFKELVRLYLEQRIPRFEGPETKRYFRKLLRLDSTEDVLYNAGIKERDMEEGKISDFQKKVLVELVTEDIFHIFNEFIKNKVQRYDEYMRKFAKALVALYSETYADMQMILVLNYSYEAYLRGFLVDEKLDYRQIFDMNEDISRISVITKLMQEKGRWSCNISWDQSTEAGKSMTEFHEKIQQFIEKMSNNQDAYYIQNKYLMEYLEKCFEDSIEHYNCFEYPLFFKVKDELETIRKDIQIVTDHEDVLEVYRTITRVIAKYKESM